MSLAPGPTRDAAFRSLARPAGGFSVVAIDQRESLRAMLAAGTERAVADDALVSFKLDVIRTLSSHASAFLLDTAYALEPARTHGVLDPACGLIVASDRLIQPPGQPVRDTEIDRTVVGPAKAAGATALKLLVLWHPDRGTHKRRELVRGFVELCRQAEVLSLVEGIVRPPASGQKDSAWLRTEGILAAARELTACDPDLYKAEVPTLGEGSADEIEGWSRRMTAEIGRPWVVLSSGVQPDRFAQAVEACCRGGASGFVAGRAIWTNALMVPDRIERLEEISAGLLDQLGTIVDAYARPWPNAVPTGSGAIPGTL